MAWMRKAAWVLALVVASGCESPSDPPPDDESPDVTELALPFEVLGAPGASRTIAFDLDEDDPALASGATLALTIHNIVEADCTTLQINDAEPIDLGDEALPFAQAGGEIAQGVVEIDASALVSGRNRLVFSYTRQVAGISGFRLLDAALNTEEGEVPLLVEGALIPVSTSTEADAIERGRRYFREESRDGGPTCGRCHASGGEDLPYFDFSDHSVVERAMFHEFTREESEDIVSYLRSLDVPRLGKVYDPPFQPGKANVTSAGAGLVAVLPDDAAFAAELSSAPLFEDVVAWDWAASVDTHELAAPIQMPTWFRWLPRELHDEWFDDELLASEAALDADPSLANARAFMDDAVRRGKELMVLEGDHHARIDLLRFAAVKLWDWSRKQGFEEPHHGFPDGAPPYPYEVGFAFFEALKEGREIEGGGSKVLAWWWLQFVVDPGRGHSNGVRPLNYEDVQTAAVLAGAGIAQLGFIHLLGSWEESRGEMVAEMGTEKGPVRLLDSMMVSMPALQREMVIRRFLRQETVFLQGGGALTELHHAKLAIAWENGCAEIDSAVRASIRAAAPEEVQADLSACP
ncbi:MAG: hypothetical protein HOW73_33320 [Polyangiaceae bacterium]|nr:hypothetical protein [Polyangiaceae bacterium]